MKFTVYNGDITTLETSCLILGLFSDAPLPPAAAAIDQAGQGALQGILARGDLQGNGGQSLLLYQLPGCRAERLLLVGCGKAAEFNRRALHKALTTAANALAESAVTNALCTLPELPIDGIQESTRIRDSAITLAHTLYRFNRCKSSDKQRPEPKLSEVTLYSGVNSDLSQAQRAATQGAAIAHGVRLARDLANLPGNLCTPAYLADSARELLHHSDRLQVKVLEQEELARLGMNALLSVAKGSREPPKLILLEYRGSEQQQDPIVLVGKGLTFDAGGISLKPAAEMDEMKYDMCGAASVLGALRTCLELQLPIHVIGMIPASENLPDGAANKPGDIVTSLSGQTIEILNTDAEGRLILCDTLSYAERYSPAAVIDVATLTGACAVALGPHAAGLFGNNEPLIQELLAASEASSDRIWQLPLWEEYQPLLDSNFADIANIGGKYGGAITAACFLSRFTQKYPWAHLDIAGVAWLQGKEKGATGRPVALLSQLLIERSGQGL